MKKRLILAVPITVVVISLVVILVSMLRPHKTVVVGMVEATEIDVAAKVPGRVDSVLVHEGDRVVKGQILATLETREIDAKVEQARGAMNAAKAKLAMAHNGARPEEREAITRLYQEAEHQYDLADKTYRRIQAVFADSVISEQERDQVEFKFKAAREERDAAKAKYQMVMKGVRSEELEAAEGLVHQAENGYNEAMAYKGEAHLISPIAGEVSRKVTDAGEILAAGYPVFTVLDTKDSWVVVQLREDQMAKVRMDSRLRGVLPALGNKAATFRVSYIAPMADFATWRATNQKGDFDLKTFEVRLRAVDSVEGLRPGMTVQVEL
jgi:HlyD family secretion protein